MKSSSISVSNAVILSIKEWIVTLVLLFFICAGLYYGWQRWENFAPGPDHRETCWDAKQSDYWAYTRWMNYAKKHYKFMLLGDSVVWGQDVRNNETITAYLNIDSGGQNFANLGNDGLFMAGINGIVKYYGAPLKGENVIVQLNPNWIASVRNDLRGKKKFQYHHPRLIPQFDKRINYFHDLNTRIGYLSDNYIRVFPFVRHLMANYYDNKSISSWMIDNPYTNPVKAITFQATPCMTEIQGKGISWLEKKMKIIDTQFVMPKESVQYGLFFDALKRLQDKKARVFVMVGPFNQYAYTPESQATLFVSMKEAEAVLDSMGIPYFDTFNIGLKSEHFGDVCHLLKEGHQIIAQAMLADPKFQEWMAGAK